MVATDTMKNVILRHALEHDGATPEGFLHSLGQRFLSSYPEMEGLRLSAAEQPFAPVPIDGAPSDRLFALGGPDHAVAELELTREAGLAGASSGHVGMRLLKTTGSAFTRFARDDATTLPERSDRPLFIHLDVHWRYADPADALAGDPGPLRRRRPGARRRRDRVPRVRLRVDPAPRARDGPAAARAFPGTRGGRLHRENHTYDPVPGMDPGADRKAYTSAFPAWGLITLTLTR